MWQKFSPLPTIWNFTLKWSFRTAFQYRPISGSRNREPCIVEVRRSWTAVSCWRLIRSSHLASDVGSWNRRDSPTKFLILNSIEWPSGEVGHDNCGAIHPDPSPGSGSVLHHGESRFYRFAIKFLRLPAPSSPGRPNRDAIAAPLYSSRFSVL